MMSGCRLFTLLVLAAVSAACSTAENGGADTSTGDTAPAASATVTVLHYQEQEAGTDSYPVRVLVNPEYLRIDDGYAESDFTLLDRAARTVSSVSHQDRNILVIPHTPVEKQLPADIHLDLEQAIDTDAPRVAGRQPVHMRFIANTAVCHEAVIVPGLLADVVEALIEYEEILGSRQQENLSIIPESLQTACFLTRYVYAPARHLRQGFPIREWDADGYRRTLVDYSEAERVAGELFRLPEAYQRYSLGEVAGG